MDFRIADTFTDSIWSRRQLGLRDAIGKLPNLHADEAERVEATGTAEEKDVVVQVVVPSGISGHLVASGGTQPEEAAQKKCNECHYMAPKGTL